VDDLDPEALRAHVDVVLDGIRDRESAAVAQ
jgi:hypothetical protein